MFSLCLSSLAWAWRITEPLKKEVYQKEAAVKANPKDPWAHFDLAITYAYTNKIEAGWGELKKVNEMDPAFKKVALDRCIKLVTDKPDDWKLRYRLAFAYYFNEKKQDALRELNNVLILDPYNALAYGYMALIEGERDNIDQAIKYAKAGLKIDSQIAALHLLLSQGYYRKGDSWNGFWEATEAVRLKALGF